MIGVWIIINPRPIDLPMVTKQCWSKIDPECKKHSSFLFAKVKPMKWLYFLRKFAFRETGTLQWYSLPKLTPWSTDENGITKFGLNYTFCQKWKGKDLEFTTWL